MAAALLPGYAWQSTRDAQRGVARALSWMQQPVAAASFRTPFSCGAHHSHVQFLRTVLNRKFLGCSAVCQLKAEHSIGGQNSSIHEHESHWLRFCLLMVFQNEGHRPILPGHL